MTPTNHLRFVTRTNVHGDKYRFLQQLWIGEPVEHWGVDGDIESIEAPKEMWKDVPTAEEP